MMTGARHVRVREPERTRRSSPRFNGYPQPTLVAFDPRPRHPGRRRRRLGRLSQLERRHALAAGHRSEHARRLRNAAYPTAHTTPISTTTRPAGDINLYLGTRGRGAWRLTFKKVAMPEIQVPAPPFFTPCVRGLQGDRNVERLQHERGQSDRERHHLVEPGFHGRRAVGRIPCHHQPRLLLPVSGRVQSHVARVQEHEPDDCQQRSEASRRSSLRQTPPSGPATAATVIADTGNFGELCVKPREVQGSAAHDQQQRRMHADHQRASRRRRASSRWHKC